MGTQTIFRTPKREFDNLVVYSMLYFVNFLLEKSITDEKPNRKRLESKKVEHGRFIVTAGQRSWLTYFFERGPIFRRAGMLHVYYWQSLYHLKKQANYINALAVSVLRLFEPAGPNTLGALFSTLGDLFFSFNFLIFM
jgi:hypothetical protein